MVKSVNVKKDVECGLRVERRAVVEIEGLNVSKKKRDTL